MDRFWVIPIIAFIVVALVATVFVEYKINVIIPNAAIEREEMKNMGCHDLLAKNSMNDYWTPVNGKIGRSMSEPCAEALKNNSGLSPYVEFCSTNPLDPPFWPDKLIQNSTHSFNHETCEWDLR